ncbi:hypothetical protein ACS0TY_020723 [Phlomoides rotata]
MSGRGRARGGGRGVQPSPGRGAQPSPGRGAQMPLNAGRGQQPSRGGGSSGRGRGGGGNNVPPPYAAPYQPSPAQSVASVSHEVEKLSLQASSSTQPPVMANPPPVQPASVTANLPPAQPEAVSANPATLSQGSAPASSKAVRNPTRPGFGKFGQKILVKANHFLVTVADRDLHHYDVSISPEVASKKVCRDIMNELVKSYQVSHLGKRMLAYDGRKSCYAAGQLPFASKEFVVKLDDQRREREFKVSIKFASKADLHHLSEFLKGRQHDVPQETLQFLDVVLRETPSKSYEVVGRSFFSPQLGNSGELGNGLEYWKGFYQSLRPTQMGLSLNIDMSARAFFEPILVSEYVGKYFNKDLSRQLTDQDRIKVRKSLRGVKVEINHPGHIRRHKILGLTTEPVKHVMFTLDSGETISVEQYFRKQYNIVLRFPNLPAIQAGNAAKPISLPMEVCTIVGGQRYSKRLNEKQVTALLRATCQRPHEREKSITDMQRKNDYNNDKLVNTEFGITVKPELTLIEARVLPPPMLKYHETGGESRVAPSVGQWNMINKKMINGGKVDYWACISFSRNIDVNRFCHELIGMCVSKGMVFNPNPLAVRTVDSRYIEKALLDIAAEASKAGNNLQLLIIVLPDITGSYGTIKRVCETELGIVSQCCQPRQASKCSKQYMENVSLKINVKVGGRNTVLEQALSRKMPYLSEVPTIIFGADVTHPQPGEDSSPSIAAVVASMDWPEVTKYRGLVSAQGHRDEIIQDLYNVKNDSKRGVIHGGMIREHLVAFYKSTKQKPHRIIFYRDGVSEGQFNQVLLHEVDAIRKACVSIEENYMPRITFVVVQKRHHTRLFPENHGDRRSTDKSGNILPGTVVDTKICHPTEFDFYLCSHAGIQGTSRPAHYHVLYDENRFTADGLQILTNSLCYTFARCTRSVSIVPPAYYAHLAAFRARYYIEGLDLSDSGSAVAGGGTRDRTQEVRPLPMIKDNKIQKAEDSGGGSSAGVATFFFFLLLGAKKSPEARNWDLWVTISPEVTSKKVCRDIMKEFVKCYGASHLGNRMLAYDGRKSCYTAGRLPFASDEFDESGIVAKIEDGCKGREFNVSIKFASKTEVHHLSEFMKGRQDDASQETLQVLDVVLRESSSKSYEVVGRSFFSPELGRSGELGNGLEYWQGFYQSLRPTQMGLSLNIDMSARAFFEPILVSEYVAKYINRDPSRPLSDQDRIKIKKSLRGVKVEVRHHGHIRRHKILDLTTKPVKNAMFKLDESSDEISIEQYFQQKYNIVLKYPNLPAIQAGTAIKPLSLPMEVCKIVEGQRYSRRLNERQVTAFLRATCQRPNEREKSITYMQRHNDYNNDELVHREFGISVRPELTSIEARVLPPPMLKYHDSGRESRVTPSIGQWNMIDNKMVNAGKVDCWACISFSRSNLDVHRFCDDLISMCSSKGMVFNQRPVCRIRTVDSRHIEKALYDIEVDSSRDGKRLQLLIIILPDITGSYGTIKRVCETELGIVSQCCHPKQAIKFKKQYMENVSLKINVKVGGRNTVLEQALFRKMPYLSEYPTIIFGADITHPQAGEDSSSPSIAAVVASMDWPEVTKYRALVSAQSHAEEIIQDLYNVKDDSSRGVIHGGMIREHLESFYKSTGRRPERIIFYRDGVSEGQFSLVLLYEVDAIRKACVSIKENYMPRITFVVVQKRHHTRLFPAQHGDRRNTDKSGNILPGTVVDTKICHPTEFDFYLCSHAGIQGTSRPAHYHVLYDENNFTADGLQILTNSLCYTCTRAVSIVPPAYYAHIAAYRARYYIEGVDFSDSGSAVGGGTRDRNQEVRPLPIIKENVKDVMFYC